MPGSRMFTRRGLAKGAFIAALVVLGLPALFTFQQYPDLLLFLVFLAAALPLAVAWGLGPAGTAVVAVGAVAIAAALYLALRSRARPGGLSVAALAAYAVVMGWAALFCLTVLGFGLGLRYEDYCLDGPNGRIELDRLPPSVACIYEYATEICTPCSPSGSRTRAQRLRACTSRSPTSGDGVIGKHRS